MAVYMTRAFGRLSRKAGLKIDMFSDAAAEVVAGQCEADLCGGVFKKRAARTGAGKSGEFLMILFFKVGSNVFFAGGFAKNEKANVTAKELAALKKPAEAIRGPGRSEIEAAERAGEFFGTGAQQWRRRKRLKPSRGKVRSSVRCMRLQPVCTGLA